MKQAELNQLLDELRNTAAMQAKINIGKGLQLKTPKLEQLSDFYALPGDDTAAIATEQGYLLHACEGMVPSFVEHHPYFAGWSAVMANISDIAAMGGYATSVVNSFWHRTAEQAQALMQGMQDACERYGVPLVGGHTHIDASFQPALSVAIQGQATQLLSVMHVRPQQKILLALNMKGQFHPETTYWKCFEHVDGTVLQAQLKVLPKLAEMGLAHAARDISNAGVLGSLLMLLEASGCGARISLDHIQKPAEVSWSHWLKLFPSYGFLLTADIEECEEIIELFHAQDIHCSIIGETTTDGQLNVQSGQAQANFWDFKQQLFTGLCFATQLKQLDKVNQSQIHPSQIQSIQYFAQELKLCQA